MNKYIDVDQQVVSKVNENQKQLVKQVIEDDKEVLNKDLYTSILRAYDRLVFWPHFDYTAFEFFKFILKKAGLNWTAYDINIGDTVNIIDEGYRYDSYVKFFDENNIEEYKDRYIKTQEEYRPTNENKLMKVIFKARHGLWKAEDENNESHDVYVLSLKNDPDKIFLYDRLGISKV